MFTVRDDDGSSMTLAFEQPELFSNRYQRNNKRGGIKNIRCFPTCGELHRERGFCGRAVTVLLTSPHLTGKDLLTIAEFVPVVSSTSSSSSSPTGENDGDEDGEEENDGDDDEDDGDDDDEEETNGDKTKKKKNNKRKREDESNSTKAPASSTPALRELKSRREKRSSSLASGGGVGGDESLPQLSSTSTGTSGSLDPSSSTTSSGTILREYYDLSMGDSVSERDIAARRRDKANPTRPWVMGEAEDKLGNDTVRYSFNRDKKGWHYGWNSNKHTCNSEHVLQVYVLERAPQTAGEAAESGSVFVVRGVFRSPSFMIFCRRRRRYNIIPTAPIAAPMTSKKSAAARAVTADPTDPSSTSVPALLDSVGMTGGKKSKRRVSGGDLHDDLDDDEENEAEDHANHSGKIPSPGNPSTITTTAIHLPLAHAGPVSGRKRKGAGDSNVLVAPPPVAPEKRKKRAKVGTARSKPLAHVDVHRLEKILRAVAKQVAKVDGSTVARRRVRTNTTTTTTTSSSPTPSRTNSALGLLKVISGLSPEDDFEVFTNDLAECIDLFGGMEGFEATRNSSRGARAEMDDVFETDDGWGTTTTTTTTRGTNGGEDDYLLSSLSLPTSSSSTTTTHLHSNFPALPDEQDVRAREKEEEEQREREEEEEAVIRNLANFLLEESDFTKGIQTLAITTRGKLKHASAEVASDRKRRAFEAFSLMLHNQLEYFLNSHALTWDDFDRIFNVDDTSDLSSSGSSRESRDLRSAVALSSGDRSMGVGAFAAFQQVVVQGGDARSSSNISSSEEEEEEPQEDGKRGGDLEDSGASSSSSSGGEDASSRPAHRLSAFSGTWEMIPDPAVDAMRASLGYPWLLRKMVSFMEGVFQVTATPRALKVRMRRKLFSSGSMEILLDGEEHSWGMKLPMFQGLSAPWKYRAWADEEGRIHHIHSDGTSHVRVRRLMWLSEDKSEMYFQISMEEKSEDDDAEWRVTSNVVQTAARVVSPHASPNALPVKSSAPPPSSPPLPSSSSSSSSQQQQQQQSSSQLLNVRHHPNNISNPHFLLSPPSELSLLPPADDPPVLSL